jgi:predicted TIM-barrel fold metal-dependent hydrolase
MLPCPPPRAVIKPPKVKAPPLSCDCHAHILGPADRYPYVPERSFTPPDALESSYLKVLSTLGFERNVVVQLSAYGTDNSRLLAAIKTMGPERACGVGAFKPDVTPATLREMDAQGIRAARFITTAKGGASLADLPDIARKVAPLGWHIEMYVPPAVWPDLLPVIDTLPVGVVFDHMAAMRADFDPNGSIFRDVMRKLESGKHWVKLCGYRASIADYPYADVKPLAQQFIRHVPDRCVWGTDWPHTTITGYMPDDGELLDLLFEWAPDEAVRHKILVENPAKLYRFNS